MGLNRIHNPKKLRDLSRIVGKTIVRGWAHYFSQPLILAVTAEKEWFVVNPKKRTAETYTDEPLIDYDERGICYRVANGNVAPADNKL